MLPVLVTDPVPGQISGLARSHLANVGELTTVGDWNCVDGLISCLLCLYEVANSLQPAPQFRPISCSSIPLKVNMALTNFKMLVCLLISK